MKPRRRKGFAWLRALASAAAAVMLSTCDLDKVVGAGGKGQKPSPSVFALTGDSVALVGAMLQFGVTTSTDAKHYVVRWTTSDSAVATIDSVTGLLRGQGYGSARVSARIDAPELSEPLIKAANLRVRYRSIKVVPLDPIRGLGLSRPIVVNGKDNADGLIQPGINSGLVLSAGDTTVVRTVGQTVVAKRNGTTHLIATFDGLRDSAIVTVRQFAKKVLFPVTEVVLNSVNISRVLPVTVIDEGDSVIVAPSVIWRTADTNVATINASTGLLRAKRADTTTVSVSADTVTRSIGMRVQQLVATLNKTSGDRQSDTVTRRLPLAPEVTVVDSGNTPISGAVVTFAVASGNGTITGASSTTNANGRAAVGSWTLGPSAGTQTLRATASGLSTTFSATGVPGKPARLVFQIHPTSTRTSSPINPSIRVAVQDSLGNVVTSASNSVTLALANNPTATTLAGTRSRIAVGGVATFDDLALGKSGIGYTLIASSGSLTEAISNAFDAVGVPTKLGFLTQPSTVGAGATLTPAVRVAVQDADSNTITTATNTITLSIATNPGSGALAGTLSKAATNGVATFDNLSLSSVGNGYKLQATGAGLTLATSVAFNVLNAGTAKKLAFSTQPSDVVAGTAVAPAIRVLVQDSAGATVTSPDVSVTLSIDPAANPGGSTLGGTITARSSNGIATFSDLTLDKVGVGYRLVATSSQLASAASSAFKVAPGSASKLGFVAQPVNTAVGSTISPAVQVAVQDANGNTVSTAAQTNVSITLSGGTAGAQLGGSLTRPTTNGVATFDNLTVSATGSAYALTATASGLTSAVSTGFDAVATNAAVKLGFVVQPKNVTAGVTMDTIKVALQNVSGATVTNAPATSVTLRVTGQADSLGVNTTTGGVASFIVQLRKAASNMTLSASAPAYASVASTSFTISPAAASRLGFLQQPNATDAGVPFAPTVRVAVQDAFGNTVDGATNAIQVALSINGSSLAGTTSVSAVGGISSFPGLRVKRSANAYTLTASAPGTSLSTVTSGLFDIRPAPASVLEFSSQPAANVTAGQKLSASGIAVQLRDSLGNAVGTPSVAVALVLTGGTAGATLRGTTTQTTSAGTATYSDLNVDKSGAGYRLNASATGFPTVASSAFSIGPASAAALTTNAGNSQSAVAGAVLAVAPSVKATDTYGNPVSGVSLTFAVGSGGGSITGATQTTNASGIAAVGSWTLGTTAGSNTLTATATGLTGSPVTFTATGTAGAASAIAVNAGNNQSAIAGSAVAIAPSVKVTDAYGNAVAGVSVTFAVGSGGGSITAASQTTNSSGIAAVGSWTLGTTAGANTLTATAIGLTGSPVTFTATGTAGAASAIAINGGNNQSATAGSAVATAPSVKVTDANSNAVSGVSVTFAVGSGGGSITGASQTTNSSGIATVGSWTLGTTAGSNTLTATATGLTGSPMTFTATGSAGAASTIAVNAGNNQSATVGSAVATAPSVKVTDANSNAVSGVSVTFAVGTGGGTITGASQTTNASGIATVGSWTLGTTAGSNTLTATVTGLTGSPVTFTATGTAGAASAITVNAGNNQSATAGSAVATAPSVKVTDAYGNAVSGVSVTFAVGTGGGSITGAAQTTNTSGIATVGSWTLGTTAGSNTLTATATGLTGSPVTFTATGTAGPASTIALNAGNNQSATAGSAVATAPSVKVTDANSNAVSGVSVTFAVGTGGGTITGASQTTNSSGIATVGSWTLGTTAGTNTLTATSPGLSGSPITFTATSVSPVAASVVVTPSATTLRSPGATQQLTAIVRDRSNATITVALTWTSSSPPIATTNASGLVTAIANGIATITATAPGGAAGIASITVDQGLIAYTKSGASADIYTIKPDGSSASQLTSSSADERSPAWSPDGKRIVFSSETPRVTAEAIYVMNADGSAPTKISPDGEYFGAPNWSPDGKRIVFHSYGVSGRNNIYAINPDGTGFTQLTSGVRSDLTAILDQNPAWSPDGSKIVFSSNRNSEGTTNQQVFVMKADGTAVTQLTSVPNSVNLDPKFSPDGTSIAFVSNRDGNNEIYVMNADGTSQRRLTVDSGDDRRPVWGPDGRRIMFSSLKIGAFEGETWIMNADGSSQQKLVAGAGSAWRP